MDIVLVPGFWLDASSWDGVTPALVAAGHRVHPLTLPGKESLDADRSGITLRDHIDAVIRVVDSLDAQVVLVGHSGGGGIVHAVADARPERIARVVYVDSGPLGNGDVINDELPSADGEIPLPAWTTFDDDDLVDLTDDLRAEFRARAIPEPAGVANGKQELSNDARYDVPVTVIACEYNAAALERWMDAGEAYVAELARITNRELVDLPTGHWPQFTRPQALGAIILDAIR